MHRDAARSKFFQRDDLRVVLVAPRNPLNIGAAARAMANFGCTRLRVVNAYDVAFREARSAVGAAPLLASAQEFQSVADAVADCKLVVGTTSVGHRALLHPLRRLEAGARIMQRTAGHIALLFGSEKFGLSNEDMSHCHWLMRIPTASLDLSMNLGQAVAVCLYELARDARTAAVKAEKMKAAEAAETEQVTAMLVEALERSGYIQAITAESAKSKVRRLVRRMNLSAHDAPVVMGMLRQILWKVGEGEAAIVSGAHEKAQSQSNPEESATGGGPQGNAGGGEQSGDGRPVRQAEQRGGGKGDR